MTKPTKTPKTVTLVRVRAVGCMGCALEVDDHPCTSVSRVKNKRDPLYCGGRSQWRIAPSDSRDSR